MEGVTTDMSLRFAQKLQQIIDEHKAAKKNSKLRKKNPQKLKNSIENTEAKVKTESPKQSKRKQKRQQSFIDSSPSNDLDHVSPSKSGCAVKSFKKVKLSKKKSKHSKTQKDLLMVPSKFDIESFFEEYDATDCSQLADETEALCSSFQEVFKVSDEDCDSVSEVPSVDEIVTPFKNNSSSTEKLETSDCLDNTEMSNNIEEVSPEMQVLSNEASTDFCEESPEIVQLENETQINEPSNSVKLGVNNDFVNSWNDTEKIMNEVMYVDSVDFKLVVLTGNSKVPFHGLASISVLHGKIEIFGSIMDKTCGERKIYSPRGSSLLYLRNINTEYDHDDTTDIINKFRNELKNIHIPPGCSVVMCKRLNEPSIAFVEKHISQQLFPKRDGYLPRCTFDPKSRDPKGAWNVINVSDEWDSVIDAICAPTKMMICGGKGVGKSTFVRYAVNVLLRKFHEVCVVDLDPGQSEFTVPGCLSIVRVRVPLLGPNYTHLQKPEYSVLSDINVGYDPKKYLSNIKLLLDKFTKDPEVPVLINYMGFSKSIGLNIASAAIQMIKPSDVLMIQSGKQKNNFKYTLTPEVTKREAKLFIENPKFLMYSVHVIRSLSDDNDGWTLVPRQMREMCLLSYLGQMGGTTENSLFSSNIPTYETNLSSVKIVDTKGMEVSPMAANANVVTLCSEYYDEQFIVQGWGIVRGIDIPKDMIVLLTPVGAEVLENIWYLVVGSVTLPPSILMTTDNIVGLVPYIHEGELPGQITKRSYIPANKRFGNA